MYWTKIFPVFVLQVNQSISNPRIKRRHSDEELQIQRDFFFFKAAASAHFSGSYLHNGIERRVSTDAEIGTWHIVTDRGRQHAQWDAKLLEVGSGLVQLQHGLKSLGAQVRVISVTTRGSL